MTCRNVDTSGDILPVLSPGDLASGTEAVAIGLADYLRVFTGEWWENPAWGNAILEMLKENRCTEEDQQALANYLTSYIRETDGVQEVRDVTFSAEDRRFSYACTVETAEGSAEISYLV